MDKNVSEEKSGEEEYEIERSERGIREEIRRLNEENIRIFEERAEVNKTDLTLVSLLYIFWFSSLWYYNANSEFWFPPNVEFPPGLAFSFIATVPTLLSFYFIENFTWF